MQQHHVNQGHNPNKHGYSNHIPNGHHGPTNVPNGGPSQPSHRNPSQAATKEPVTVVGIPSVTVQGDKLVVGGAQSSSTRSYTPLKVVGDGSFGTVWLCDWHGSLPPNTPLSAMQCSGGARPEYANKRLVAVKRMKKRWEGGWEECQRLKELESLRRIPNHPNIIPLYDFFILPSSKELYFVFEPMEGNLYQLIKARKGKPLAGGLVSSIFHSVVQGLHHIHAAGYFHRDMKPENLLVTTIGLHNYRSVLPGAPPDAVERDVLVIIKLADFGLARETKSRPPYTEYVSTRWYRAPEVLLKSRDYSNPVDMWALGTIMAEVVNLRPLFPGADEFDQLAKITDLLGDPVGNYGVDSRGMPVGGGQWPRGVEMMANHYRMEFKMTQPKSIYALFDRNVPIHLVNCIADLLKYQPELRLTSEQCLNHPYLKETLPLNRLPPPPTRPASAHPAHHQNGATPTATRFARSHSVSIQNNVSSNPSLPPITPRSIPPSHSHLAGNPKMHPPAPSSHVLSPHLPDASSSHRSSFYDSGYASIARSRTRSVSETSEQTSYSGDVLYSPRTSEANQAERLAYARAQADASACSSSVYSHGADRIANINGWQQSQTHQDYEPMDVTPHMELPPNGQYVTAHHLPMDVQTSPMAQEYPARPAIEPEPQQGQGPKFPKLFGKKQKWGLGGMFGHGDKHNQTLPPVQENGYPLPDSMPSLKRRESSSTDSRSLSELSPVADLPRAPPANSEEAKQRKKEQERIAKEVTKEAEKQRRIRAEENQRDQARAVMKKNRRLANPTRGTVYWASGAHGTPHLREHLSKGKQTAGMGPIRQSGNYGSSSLTVDAAGGSYKGVNGTPSIPNQQSNSTIRTDWYRDPGSERLSKARRRDYDDDHSMSSDMHSGMSIISFATVDSDPGPGAMMQRRGGRFSGIGRMQSMSSLHASSIDEYPTSGRSSASLSLEQHLAQDFHRHASVGSPSLNSDGGSPQPPSMTVLSLSSPIPFQHSDASSSTSTVDNRSMNSSAQPHNGLSPVLPPQQRHPGMFLNTLGSYDISGVGPPSPGMAPKSAINPMFKVPSFAQPMERPSVNVNLTSLPPFSQLEAVADGDYPPLSPMSFTIPEEDSEIGDES